ncbi:MAG TPA: hypothetical protein VM842_04240 [Nitrospira sp.]|jgi:hypothetical protein|nr:hypothetical protein [Nitrospira sp.]
MFNNQIMPSKKTAVVAAVVGIGLACTTVYAEHARTLKEETRASQGSHYRNQDLSGGFYEDRYKRDNWYYDFYESPGATRTTSYIVDGRQVDMTDAAHPRTLQRSAVNDQSMAYQQYYDEPWFYNQRDPSYGMPMAGTGDPMVEPASRQDNMIKGTVSAVKQVRNRTTGEQNTVALIKTADNRSVISDLGSTRSTLDMALSKGDNIQVGGQWEDIGDYSVLMAQQVKSGANRAWLNRGGSAVTSDNRRVEGRIQQFRDIRVKRTGELHRTAAVQTADGRYSIVDLGPTASEPTNPSASAGDRIVANGRVIDVGNYPVLLANQVSINDGSSVNIARPTGSWESSPRTTPTDPNCVGGGCSSQPTTSHGQSRDPHTNAMDGTIR